MADWQPPEVSDVPPSQMAPAPSGAPAQAWQPPEASAVTTYKPGQVELTDHSIPALKNAYRAMGGNPDLVPDQEWEQQQLRYQNPTPSTPEGEFGQGISRFFNDAGHVISSLFSTPTQQQQEIFNMKRVMGDHQLLEIHPERADMEGNYVTTDAQKAGYAAALGATGLAVSVPLVMGGEAVLPAVTATGVRGVALNVARSSAIGAVSGAGSGAVVGGLSNPDNPGEGATEGAKGGAITGALGGTIFGTARGVYPELSPLGRAVWDTGTKTAPGLGVTIGGVGGFLNNPDDRIGGALQGAERGGILGLLLSGNAKGVKSIFNKGKGAGLDSAIDDIAENYKNNQWYQDNSHLFGRPQTGVTYNFGKGVSEPTPPGPTLPQKP
jgi:hypothetical protein